MIATELLERISAGVISVGADGAISFANRTALRTLGLTVNGCIGAGVAEAFGGSSELAELLATMAPGEERRLDLGVRRPDATVVDVGITVLRCDAATPQTSAILVFRDLQIGRHLEAELRRVERLSALGSTVAGFAHGIRNPIAAIQGLTEALGARLGAEDPRHQHVERILAQVKRIEGLVSACLHFGDPRPPMPTTHDASVPVAAALDALRPRLRQRTIRLESPPEPLRVSADVRQIAEVLVHLLENSLDATGNDPERVCIRLSARREPADHGKRTVRIEVVDQGSGIPASLKSRIFDPFFTTKPQGTGLGLSLVQALVAENEGHVSVQSAPAIETTFTIDLPEGAA